jgi:ubiquinone/menaquinone biosynthesis C-methylase UbiE
MQPQSEHGPIIITDEEVIVQRVNELYHDLIGERYSLFHPEIFEREKDRWQRIAKHFLVFSVPIIILDIGTGTGFVPLTIANFLKKNDVFICSDISEGILDVARTEIEKQSFRCQFKFVKIERRMPFSLPFQTESVDIVTMNSVLHHIENTNAFLSEVDRILKPNGSLFIAHEPNEYFHKNKFLSFQNLMISAYLARIRSLIVHVINPKLILSPGETSHVLGYKRIADNINEVMIKERLIRKPLSPEEIGRIMDIRALEGFKPNSLMPNYTRIHLETYDHVFWTTISARFYKNLITRKYDNLMSRTFPNEGTTFFTVLRKPEQEG